MRFLIYDLRFAICASGSLALGVSLAPAQLASNVPSLIDLPTALRLAGAQNLDVQIAREKVREARANHQGALAQFFPWIAPGIAYRQHDDRIQDVQGNIFDVDKYSYAPGVALAARVELGEAIYQSLAAKQLAVAAGHAEEAQRQQSVLEAARGYFDLALAQSAVAVNGDSVRIAADYEAQVLRAVEAGLAFKGDALRAGVQKERNELARQQMLEHQRIAAARLARTLRLDPTVELRAQESDLVPLDLVTNTALDALVARALANRSEFKQQSATVDAARTTKKAATYGPLIPTLEAQAFFGGLGGGRDGVNEDFGPQQDYFVGASWRIGPGGLFDFTRVRARDARLKTSELNLEKVRDELKREVVEAATAWQSKANQIMTAKRALAAAEEGWQLARRRKEFGVGVVLETVQAERDLTLARLEYLQAVAAFNQAQYTLQQTTGGL